MKFDKEEDFFEVSSPPLLLSVDQEEQEEEFNEEKVNPPDDQMTEEEQEDEVEDETDDDKDDQEEDVNEEEEEEDDDDEVSEEWDGEEQEEEWDGEEQEEVEEQAEEKEEGEEEEEGSSSCSTLVPTTASPYIVFHHGKRNCKQTFYSMSEDNYSVRSVPDMCGMTCCASSHGWLVMLDNDSDQCFLLNPVSMEKIQLPPMKMTSSYRKAYHCVLTSSPSDSNNCVVMFVSSYHVACLFCRLNDQNWTRRALGPDWKSGLKSSFNMIDAVVSCNGKIYITYSYGAAITVLHIPTMDDHTDKTTADNHHIDDDDDLIDEDTRRNNLPTTFRVLEKIKIDEKNRPLLQRFNNTTIMLSHLVESCGKVYLVIKIYWGGSGHNEDIYNFEVYKLNSSSSNGGPAWEKVESLGGDRLFFLGKGCSFSFPASKIGMKENYIFFFEPDDECLYSYNMEDQSISIDQPCPNIVHPRTQPYWMGNLIGCFPSFS